MIEIDFEKKDIQKFAQILGLGYYRVTEKGQFVECNSTAREIFNIPQEETDLSKYSIKDLYVSSAERKMRIDKLLEGKYESLFSTLSLKINGENKLLLDICMYDESYRDQGNFVGFVSNIEESTIPPKIFDTFPIGLYAVDEESRFVRVNKKFIEILKYKNEGQILDRHLKDFFESEKSLELFNHVIKEQGFARDILRLRDANGKIIEVECFAHAINKYGIASWAIINDVTIRELYYRALDRLPTGFFYIENERIKECNDQFVRIQGFKNKDAAIGVHSKILFVNEEDRKKYIQDLIEADEKGHALQNYEFQVRRVDDGSIITVLVDSQLVKDSNGNIIGREGTIRDITREVELRYKFMKAENKLEKSAVDINKFIHTFLHPAIKFAGNSKLLYQAADTLNQSIKQKAPSYPDAKELGEKITAQLIEIRDNLFEDDGIDPLVVSTLRENLTKIINVFDYRLQSEESSILLDKAVRDTALEVLENLNRINYSKQSKLKTLIKKEFIDLLQGIILNYLQQGTKIMMSETEIMKRGVETFRSYIGLETERKYIFAKCNIGKILEKNLQLFESVLSEENIEIDLKCRGNLFVEISEYDIDRVICNLLLNVKKYSYKGQQRFIKIRARELQPQNQVEISIENFGVPIKKEEIDSGAIWEFGYRGELAYARDRDGTGIGLADAKNVINAHRGEIFITSKPVKDDGDPPQYKVPYLTKVTIKIPRERKE